MKKYMSGVAVALLALSMTGCSLDPEVTEYVTQERQDELINDSQTKPGVAKASMGKAYAVLQEFWDSHDNFGLKAFQLAVDEMGEDISYIGKYNWFQFDYMIQNRNATWRRTRSTWDQFYSVISKINLQLETYYAEESSNPDDIKGKAEALALRGIAYFHLVNFYQKTYKGHEKDLGVPLPLKSTDEFLPRATVEEVYKQIIEDLTNGVEYGPTTKIHTDADRYVAAAYLAKAYAHMEDWANVEKYSAIAMEGGTDKVTEPGRSWNIDETDILWGYDVNSQNSTLWASYWSHVDAFMVAGYAVGGANKGIWSLFYNKIPKTDSRRKLWINTKEYPEVVEAAKKNSANPKVNVKEYDQMKFIAGLVGMEQDYCFIRVQDPILLHIEALNEQGKTADAATELNNFVQLRDPAFVAATTQDELREQIRFQRRLELWGEGSTWFDLKRWKHTINRTGDPENNNHTFVLTMSVEDDKYIHMLPQKEMDANPNLVQNP